jgi:hypothetical protein
LFEPVESWPGIPKGNFRFSPRCLTDLASIARDYATVRTLAVIFVLALITIAFEVYSDASSVSKDISHMAVPDQEAPRRPRRAAAHARFGSRAGKGPATAYNASSALRRRYAPPPIDGRQRGMLAVYFRGQGSVSAGGHKAET